MNHKSNHLNNNTNKCYIVHKRNNLPCNKQNCKNWIENTASLNCVKLAVLEENYTLSEIGNLYGLTRMRICQIEKSICKKIKNSLEET
jgi:DNA-directed RNA polymerase specialized sigma subunit